MITREQCYGCYDDCYNGSEGARCWSAKTGEMMTRYQIHFMQVPTAKGAFTKVKRPSCYRQVNENIFYNKLPDFVNPSDLNRAKRIRKEPVGAF